MYSKYSISLKLCLIILHKTTFVFCNIYEKQLGLRLGDVLQAYEKRSCGLEVTLSEHRPSQGGDFDCESYRPAKIWTGLQAVGEARCFGGQVYVQGSSVIIERASSG